jgi:very-short-patch-repair endonuclease
MSSLQLFGELEFRFVEHPEGKYGFGMYADDLAIMLEASSGKDIIRCVDETWKDVRSVQTPGGKQKVNIVWEPGIKQLLQKSRKPKARLVAEQLGLDLDIHRSSIESDTIRIIKSAFQHLNPVDQFFVSGYRIDLYFPQHRIAVECDEYHHSYKAKQDVKRQDIITKTLGCSWVRYAPYKRGFCIGNVINTLIKKIYNNNSVTTDVLNLY